MNSDISTESDAYGIPYVVGIAPLVRHAYAGRSLAPIWQKLTARIAEEPEDAAALMDMSVVLQVAGHREKAMEVQAGALSMARSFQQTLGQGDGLRVLAFMTAGDLMANTPLDFLLDGTDATLFMRFVDADTADLAYLPEHDVAFVAVGESEANRPVLANLQRLLSGWRGPIVNNAPDRIMGLTRDGVAAALAGEPAVLAPATRRLPRDLLRAIAGDERRCAELLPGGTFPLVIRPVGSHAGQGMEKIDDRKVLSVYLAERTEAAFYVATYVDYRGPDGLFRKQRIAFIDGRAFPSHLAVSEHWIVHYLSAGMTEHPRRRAEEAAWMEHFDSDFAVRHAAAFEALHRRIGLDYFGIDCAEAPDGRLLLFEADTAMIVHSMDPEDMFPYKKPAMRRLFDAFQASLRRRCEGADAVSAA